MIIEKTRGLANDYGLSAEYAHSDMGEMLCGMVFRVHDRMAETDRILHGDGIPPLATHSRIALRLPHE